jgi:hypothetical protein
MKWDGFCALSDQPPIENSLLHVELVKELPDEMKSGSL